MEQRRRTLAASLMLLLWALVISACFCSGFNFSSFAGGQKYSLRRQFWTQKPPIFEQSGCSRTVAAAGQGFGTSPPKRKRKDGTANGKKPSQKRRDVNFNSSTSSSSPPLSSSSTTIRNRPLVKSEQEELLSNLAIKSSKSIIGQTVSSSVELLRQRLSNISSDSTSSEDATKLDIDPFWELIPSLLTSKFPLATNEQLQRVAGFIRYALLPRDILPLEQNIIQNKWRPHEDIHAYMPQLDNEEGGAPPPFLKPNQIELCSKLEQNYNVILQEYDALIRHMEESGIDRFQSVTSMNYESGMY